MAGATWIKLRQRSKSVQRERHVQPPNLKPARQPQKGKEVPQEECVQEARVDAVKVPSVANGAKFFEAGRSPMSLSNWTHNVTNLRQRSSSVQRELHVKKNTLKRKRAWQLQEEDNVFDEDVVQEARADAVKVLSIAEQKNEGKMKRRCITNRFFSLGEERGDSSLAVDPNVTRPASELFPAEQGEQLSDVDALLAKDQRTDYFLANVTYVVEQAIAPIRANDNGGTLSTMAQGAIAPQMRTTAARPAGEVHSVEFMQLWLREADTTRGERSCPRGKECEGAKLFSPHIHDETRVRTLQEFLPFEERMHYYQTGNHSSQTLNCLLCNLMGACLSWTLAASMLESHDYSGDPHCDFSNLFNVPGEFLKEFACNNPPGQFFGLLAPVVIFLPEMFQPVRRTGTDHLLALKIVPEALLPATKSPPLQYFH